MVSPGVLFKMCGLSPKTMLFLPAGFPDIKFLYTEIGIFKYHPHLRTGHGRNRTSDFAKVSQVLQHPRLCFRHRTFIYKLQSIACQELSIYIGLYSNFHLIFTFSLTNLFNGFILVIMATINDEMRAKIEDLRDRGAAFFVSHSGGKDSQTQTLEIARLVPADQIVIVHADLVEQDWDGAYDHLVATAPAGVKIIKCRSRRTFFEMVRSRGMWPSPKYRQCTSDLKRTPIEKAIRHELKDRGKLLAASCMGIRAEESYTRAKAIPIKVNNRLSKAGREIWDLLPIKDFTTQEVFERIAAAGQRPHWIYKHLGRLSCIVCIFGTPKDIRISAGLRPDIFAECVSIEKEISHTIKIGQTLEEFAGITAGSCKGCDHWDQTI